MTQALNLANLANSINSSGQLAGSAINGAVANATTATTAGTANALNSANSYAVQSLSANGILIAVSPNSGSSGGVVIKQNVSGGNCYIQFTNNSASSEFGDISVSPSNVMNLTATGGLTLNGLPLIKGLGFGGEVWHGVSKSANTTYTNSYNYPIMVAICWADPGGIGTVEVIVDGSTNIMTQGDTSNSYSFSFIVTPGSNYIVTASGAANVYQWSELF